jgi:apolipoprotein N-acyltransferase
VSVPLSRSVTPFVRFGDWVQWLSVAVVAAWLGRRVVGARLQTSGAIREGVDKVRT